MHTQTTQRKQRAEPIPIHIAPEGNKPEKRSAFDSGPLPREMRGPMEALYKASPLLGDSPAIQELRDFIVGVSLLNEPVLITGPPGTGKELAARKVHAVGRTARAPFHRISCEQHTAEDVEYLLFGSETPGCDDGILGARSGGTCYLSGIEHMSFSLMGRLTHYLLECPRDAERVRLVLSSRFPLEDLLEGSCVDSAFLEVISCYHMGIPALRERMEDIPILCSYQLWLHSGGKNYQGRWDTFRDEVLPNFLSYSWPGNVAELNGVVQRYCSGELCVADGADLCEALDLDSRESSDGAYLSRRLDELFHEFLSVIELERLTGRTDLLLASNTRQRELN